MYLYEKKQIAYKRFASFCIKTCFPYKGYSDFRVENELSLNLANGICETPAGQLNPVTSWDCAKCSSHRKAL